MQDPILASGLDTVLVALPLVALMAFGVFRLDSILALPEGRFRQTPRPCGMDEHGEPIGCDPDGRVWGTAGAAAGEGRARTKNRRDERVTAAVQNPGGVEWAGEVDADVSLFI